MDVLNLFDETPEPYGPKEPDRSRAGDSTGFGAKRQNAHASGLSGPGSLGLRRGGELITEYTPHPSGPPPLDWWVIDG